MSYSFIQGSPEILCSLARPLIASGKGQCVPHASLRRSLFSSDHHAPPRGVYKLQESQGSIMYLEQPLYISTLWNQPSVYCKKVEADDGMAGS